MCWIILTDKRKKKNVILRICFPKLEGYLQQESLFWRRRGFIEGRWGRGQEKVSKFWNLFIKACFSCLNLLVLVSVTVFITQPQCANKPHMFRLAPYLLSQDKVEMSILQEICDRVHTQTHSGRGWDLSYSYLFSSTQDAHKEGTQ